MNKGIQRLFLKFGGIKMALDRSFTYGLLLEEFSIKIPTVCVLMANGDIELAIFFNRLIELNLDEDTEITIKNNEQWIVKKDSSWFSECFLTVKQVQSLKRKAIKQNLIKTKKFKFKEKLVTHITFTEHFEPLLLKSLNYFYDHEGTPFPKTKEELQKLTKNLQLHVPCNEVV